MMQFESFKYLSAAVAMNNPYQSPARVSDKPSVDKPSGERPAAMGVVWLLHVAAWLYPAILVSAFYGTWLVAWLSLGHMPRPSLDDPKSISVLVDVPYMVTGLLLVAFPAAALAGAVVLLSSPRHSWVQRILGCSIYVVVWIFAISFLRWDPLEVGTWFMD